MPRGANADGHAVAELTRVAILGAGGFIGSRAVEMLHLGGKHEVVAIARRASGLALAGRFDLSLKVADAFDQTALAAAFAGCDAVVAAIAGDLKTIVDTVAPLYAAAGQAGVRRIVYLSTASVHGQAPAPGTDERSPLSLRQPFAYNRAKIVAEQRLLSLRARGRTEIVILRPGIVYGPRSQWTGGLADQLLAGEAFLADGGSGVCNAIYVDNVVHSIERAIVADAADGEALLIGDRERVTWRDLTAPVAEALGIDLDSLPQPASAAILAHREPFARRVLKPAAQALLRKLPRRIGDAQRAARHALLGTSEQPAAPSFSRELALLHSCQVRLPSDKAERLIGFDPPIDFAEGCRRSVCWLRFAGYPVRR